MKPSSDWSNLSLAQLEMEKRKGFVTKGGQEWRTTCPFHQGNNPTAFSVCLITGKFYCFACGAKGVLLDFRYGHKPVIAHQPFERKTNKVTVSRKKQGVGFRLQNQKWWQERQQDLWRGENYLNLRGISLTTAHKYGLGYSHNWRFVTYGKDGQTASTNHYSYQEAILFPTTGPQGFINLYARGISLNKRLHHIPAGNKGIFNYAAVCRASEEQPVILVEGGFDALAVIEAGYPNVAALIGLSLGNLEWYRNNPHIILAFDNDRAGHLAAVREAHKLKQIGITPKVLPSDLWHSHKDFSSFWQANRPNITRIRWDEVIERSQPIT